MTNNPDLIPLATALGPIRVLSAAADRGGHAAAERAGSGPPSPNSSH